MLEKFPKHTVQTHSSRIDNEEQLRITRYKRNGSTEFRG